MSHIYFNSVPELKNVFVEATRKRKQGQEVVFTTQDGSPIPKWYMERLLRKACDKARVGPYRFHDLRHTFNTTMSKAGVKDAIVMKLTGHKTLAMFLRYSHLDKEQGDNAMKLLDNYLSSSQEQAENPKKEKQEK